MTPASQPNRHAARLTSGPIRTHLTRMTLPMIAGIFSVLLFGVVDSYFVSLLGTLPLAAVSFTFPVTFVITNILIGIGIGTTAAVSRSIGGHDHGGARMLATHGVTLSIVVAIVIAAAGLLTIDPLFRLLGAGREILGLIHEYMTLWYFGLAFVAAPIVGNGAIRATGNTRLPSIIMLLGAGLNAVLDPLFIFGLFGFPRLEVQGAALATVIAWFAMCIFALWAFSRHEHLADKNVIALPALFRTWRRILIVAIPAGITNILTPVAAGVLTAIIAEYGAAAVAGFGVGSRIEPLALVVVIALGMALPPFVGQNAGARDFERVHAALNLSLRFAMVWGAVVYAILALNAANITHVFSADLEVQTVLRWYLWLLPLSYGCEGMVILISSTLNALGLATHSMTISCVRLFGIYVPLAYTGSALHGIVGLLAGATLGHVLGGIMAFYWYRRLHDTRFHSS